MKFGFLLIVLVSLVNTDLSYLASFTLFFLN